MTISKHNLNIAPAALKHPIERHFAASLKIDQFLQADVLAEIQHRLESENIEIHAINHSDGIIIT